MGNPDTDRCAEGEDGTPRGACGQRGAPQGLEFRYGEKCLTLKDLQRFRGVATGWSIIVRGLKNELKAADRFLGGVDGAAVVQCSGTWEDEQAAERAWEDLLALFDDCRWLCAR